ncbi:MAG: hypothetical protein HYW05_03450 [Candidatus Diapherotrites archaeon]|nr:hypothetical protein [Candidatus Diapherotrites archaeon]
MPARSRSERRREALAKRKLMEKTKRESLRQGRNWLARLFRKTGQAFRQEFHHKPINAMGRREFIKRSAIAAGLGIAALYGSKWAMRRLPYWLGAKKKYKIVFVFAPHAYKRDVRLFESVIESYEKNKQPFHVFGVETAGFSAKDRIEHEKRYAGMLNDLRNIIESGKSAQEIRAFINAYVEAPFPEFTHGITPLIAKKGFKLKSIEAAGEKDLGYFKSAAERFGDLSYKIQNAKSLEEHKRIYSESLAMHAKNNALRNRHISEHIPKVIAEIERDFPDLAKNEQIRILYQVGSTHSDVYLEQLARRLKSVEFEVIEPIRASSQTKIIRMLGKNEHAKINDLLMNRALLADAVEKYGIPARIDSNRVLEVMDAAENASQRDFENLKMLTEGMSLPERGRRIFDYFSSKAR